MKTRFFTWSTTPTTDGDFYTPTTNTSVASDLYNFMFSPDHNLTYRCLEWLRIVMFFVAILGNSLSFLVFSTKQYRDNLHSMLYRILAVTDTLVVTINDGLDLLPMKMVGQSLLAYNLTSCKIIGVLFFWLRALSIWLLVPIALERFIAVWFPYRASRLNTKTRYGCMILVLSIIIFAFYAPTFRTMVHHIFMLNGQKISSCYHLGTHHEHLMWYSKIFNWVNLLVSSLLPFLCIITFNMAIIYGLLKSRTRLWKTLSKAANSEMYTRVVILLLISITTIILSLPYPIYFIVISCRCEWVTSPKIILLGFILPILDSISHSINIVLYCISGRQFRENLRQLFSCTDCCKKTPGRGN